MVDEHYVRTLGEVAEIFGVGADTVKHWRTGPDPMPGKPKAWPVFEIVRWRFERTVRDRDPKKTDEQREQLELEKLSTDVHARRLKLARDAGELVNREAAIGKVAEMFHTVRQRMLALPEELASSLPQEIRSTVVADLKHKMNLVCKEFESWSGDDAD